MTSGRKFSTRTSAFATSFLKISLPSGALRFSVTDFLLAFWARKLVPISILLYFGTLPSSRARSPRLGVLDLDDLGAEEREVQRAERPGEDIGQVEDADSGESSQACHLAEAAVTSGDRAGLVDHPGHLAAEEAAHVAGDVDERSRCMSRRRPCPLQHVDEVLGADVSAGDLRERTAAEARHRGLEVLHAHPRAPRSSWRGRGRRCCGSGRPLGALVEIAGPACRGPRPRRASRGRRCRRG